MTQRTLSPKPVLEVVLFLFLFSPVPTVGQFVLPFLYMPLKPLFPQTLGTLSKHLKVTSEHVRIKKEWNFTQIYGENIDKIQTSASGIIAPLLFDPSNLTDLDYSWSYNISFTEADLSLSSPQFVKARTAAYMQEELLKIVSQKFRFDLNSVASSLGIQEADLWTSFNPANWTALVHVVIEESSSSFTRLLELPSVNYLAKLVDISTADLLNANLSRFEDLVFPFIRKKAILDTNTTSHLINSSGIVFGKSHNDVTVGNFAHENLTLCIAEFGILYNLTTEQTKAIGKATFYQISLVCGVSFESIKDLTLPEVSWRVVGSVHLAPPCPVLISIKGKSISSFASLINPQTTTVLELLTTVSNLTWREVHLAVDASLPDWEFVDSVTLSQLADISGFSLESLKNDAVSEAVELVFRTRANGKLIRRTEAHRLFIRDLLEKKYNLTLNEVANLTKTPEVSLISASAPWLFRSFLNATISYFGLNFSEIVSTLQVSKGELFNLPRQEWMNVITAIIDPVLKSAAANLQMSTEDLLQLLGISSVEPSISKLKDLIRTEIREAKENKRRFETDPIDLYLSQNSVSETDYLNSTVLSLGLAATGYNSNELKRLYGFSEDGIFILGSLRIGQLPLYCALNTSAIKGRTFFNITAELVGNKGTPANCKSTKFYLAARVNNMSLLQTEFSLFSNATISYVILVEKTTNLPWRLNVWAFDLKAEDWTVLYVLNEDSYNGLGTTGNYQSTTLFQIFKESVQLQANNNNKLRSKLQQNRDPALIILYKTFETTEEELVHLSRKTEQEYRVLYPIEVFSLMIEHYLVDKFNVSLNSIAVSLDVKPGDIEKLSPTEWPEMIPYVEAEIIRSGQYKLGVSRHDFAKLMQATPDDLQNFKLAQLKDKWNGVVTRLLKGKMDLREKSVSQVVSEIGEEVESLNGETVLAFIEHRVNVTKDEVVILYNFSPIAIDVLSNYTFAELPGLCEWPKDNLFQKKAFEIIVSLLGYNNNNNNNDISCRKISTVAAASSITVEEWATKFGLHVNDSASLLLLFGGLFKLPWPKIAWAVNASLRDWPILGAVSLNNVAMLTGSQTTQNMKLQKSFREITMQLLGLPENSYAQYKSMYRSSLVIYASDLFGVNASKICFADCDIVDILWNSLLQLNMVITFDPYVLPQELNSSRYEFNLTIPSQWPLLVQPVIRESYLKASLSLDLDRGRLSSLLQMTTSPVLDLNLVQYQAVFVESIRPYIDAKHAYSNSRLAVLIASKGLTLSAVKNKRVFDVINAVLSVPAQNISFIFNWTEQGGAKLRSYHLVDVASYRGTTLESLGNETLSVLVQYIFSSLDLPTIPPTTLPPCKRGFERVGNAVTCSDRNECSSRERCGDDSLCQNYLGGFDCECKDPGHFKVDVDSNCEPCKTFSGTLTISNRELSFTLKNRSTEEFYDMKEIFETTVTNELKKSSVGEYYYGCRVKDLRSGSIIVDFLIFTSPDFAGTMQEIRDALVGRVNNTKLGSFNVTASEVAVEDFDECMAHQDNCGHHATCVNKEGSFECKCNDGFEGDGISCEGGFLKTMWWTVIVAAFLLLLIIIIIVCLIVKRPKPLGRYALEMTDAVYKLEPNSRNSGESSKVSYRKGDVYYKDKDGNSISGTGNRPNMLTNGHGLDQRSHTLPFAQEDETQPSSSTRDKTPLELAMERNKRISGEIPPAAKTPFELAVERNAWNNNTYEEAKDLKLSELPIASIKSSDTVHLDHCL
ncbi:LOW QUALITY PROTEIN: uncharacterized protein [Montipora capricornis]|uniref:LOW QUALITY PROTEIN: uncharacterized protein n=1 Tax=Montipora capricornis TaxID=246305 RepID=UPI0035F10E86